MAISTTKVIYRIDSRLHGTSINSMCHSILRDCFIVFAWSLVQIWVQSKDRIQADSILICGHCKTSCCEQSTSQRGTLQQTLSVPAFLMIISVKRERMDWEVQSHQARTGVSWNNLVEETSLLFLLVVKEDLASNVILP